MQTTELKPVKMNNGKIAIISYNDNSSLYECEIKSYCPIIDKWDVESATIQATAYNIMSWINEHDNN